MMKLAIFTFITLLSIGCNSTPSDCAADGGECVQCPTCELK